MTFSLNAYRTAAGDELKQRLAESGETFDVVRVEQDMGDYGPMWVVDIKYGDAQDGKLFFKMASDSKPNSRDAALAGLALFLEEAPGVLYPAVVKHTKTRKGQDYFWLEDGQ